MRKKTTQSNAPKAYCNKEGVTHRICVKYAHSGLCGAHGLTKCKHRELKESK